MAHMDRPCFDAAWESSGNEALVMWARGSESTVRYIRWTKGAPLSSSAVQVGPESGGELSTIDALAVPGADQVITLVCNVGGELRSILWDGDAFVTDPGVLLSTNISSLATTCCDLAKTGK